MRKVFNIHILYVTVFVGILAIIVTETMSRISFLEPISDSVTDWDFTDLSYNNIETDSPKIDDRIVLVNISDADTMNRQGIAHLVRKISKHEPKVIGMLVFYSNQNNNQQDSLLSKVLGEVKNLVMVAQLVNGDSVELSAQLFLSNGEIGLSNLQTGEFGTIRKIIASKDHQGNTLRSFASETVRYYNKTLSDNFNDRNNEWEWIKYSGNINSFQTLDYYETDFSIVKDKIVLIGYLGEHIESGKNIWNITEKFYTPLKATWYNKQLPDMFGLVIHANAIKMILDQNYIDSYPLANDLISTILMIGSSVLFYFIILNWRTRYNVIARLCSFIIVALSIYLTIEIFRKTGLKIDLKIAVLFLLFIPDTLELYDNYYEPAYKSLSIWIQYVLATSVIILFLSPYILSVFIGYDQLNNSGFDAVLGIIALLWMIIYTSFTIFYWVKQKGSDLGKIPQ